MKGKNMTNDGCVWCVAYGDAIMNGKSDTDAAQAANAAEAQARGK